MVVNVDVVDVVDVNDYNLLVCICFVFILQNKTGKEWGKIVRFFIDSRYIISANCKLHKSN